MTPFDEFITAARKAFERNRDADWATIALFLAAAVLGALGLSFGLRRWRAWRRVAAEIAGLSAAAGLDSEDLDFLRQISGGAGLSLVEVMTSLTPFEHATAELLATQPPTLRPAEGSEHERIRRLRKALGFSPLAPHLWLLTSRELVVGDSVALGEAASQVAEVNEACFAIDLPAAAVPRVGTSAALTINRPDDARYQLRVRLLGVEKIEETAGEPTPDPSLRRAFFTHDEQPIRQQQREHVRVRVQGAVTVKMPNPARGPSASTKVAGTLVDVSAGGLALDLPASPDHPLRRGARIRCSFTMGDGQSFEDLGALVVAATDDPPAGVQHLRVFFTNLTQAKRDALAAAVAKQQRSLAHVSQAPTKP